MILCLIETVKAIQEEITAMKSGATNSGSNTPAVSKHII